MNKQGLADAPQITITSPRPGDSVSNQVHVVGRGTVFEGHIAIRVVDQLGTVVGEGYALGGSLGIPEPFGVVIAFDKSPKAGSGVIEAFGINAVDGSESDLYRVPISFDVK